MLTRLKLFSASCRVHNHFTKRILNLILNRKKVLRRRNETLGNLIRGKTAAANPARYTFSTNFVLVRRSSLERRRKLCAEALHHPFSNMSSQPCIFHCPSKQRTSNRSPDSIIFPCRDSCTLTFITTLLDEIVSSKTFTLMQS